MSEKIKQTNVDKGIKILLSTDEKGIKSYLCNSIAYDNELKKHNAEPNKPASKTSFKFYGDVFIKNTHLDMLVEKN